MSTCLAQPSSLPRDSSSAHTQIYFVMAHPSVFLEGGIHCLIYLDLLYPRPLGPRLKSQGLWDAGTPCCSQDLPWIGWVCTGPCWLAAFLGFRFLWCEKILMVLCASSGLTLFGQVQWLTHVIPAALVAKIGRIRV